VRAVLGNPRPVGQRDGRALYKRAWDEQVASRYRAGEPAPGMSRERFLRLLVRRFRNTAPMEDDWLMINVVDEGHQAFLEFVF
jgi:hypothetical protein